VEEKPGKKNFAANADGTTVAQGNPGEDVAGSSEEGRVVVDQAIEDAKDV